MVAQNIHHAPEQNTRRERRIEILEERRRVKKIMKKLRPVTFDNDTITETGNFQFIELFKKLVGFEEIVSTHLQLERAGNCVYSSTKLMDFLTDCALLGHTRFLLRCKRIPVTKSRKRLSDFPMRVPSGDC